MKDRNIGWYGAYYEPRHFRHCGWHCAVTEDVRRWLSVEHGIDATRTTAITPFSDLDDAIAADRAALGVPNDAFFVLALARLDPVKGLDLLIDLARAVPDLHVRIAGEGPERKALQTRIARDGLGDRVRLLGWRDDRAALLKAADALVFPSRTDSFGAVMIEAWQIGTPVIATAAPGPKALLAHGVTGLLVPVDDVEALRVQVLRLRDDPDLAASLRRHGERAWRARFSREAYVAAQIDFYERVLQCVGKGGMVSARLASR